MMDEPSKFTRKASAFEKLDYYRSEYGYYSNFSVTAQYSRAISKEQLFFALRSILLKNSIFTLNYRPSLDVRKPEDVSFECVKQVLIDKVVIFLDQYVEYNADVLRFVHENVPIHCGGNEPLWRLVILGDSKTVIVTTHHGLFDGESCAQFHSDLLRQFNEQSTSTHASEIGDGVLFDLDKDSNCVEILPSGEELVNHVPSMWHFIKSAFGYYVYPSIPLIHYFDRMILQHNKPLLIPPGTVYKMLNISPDKVSSIAAKCHDLNISVTVWLLLCLQYSMKDNFDSKGVNANVAVNIRRLLPSGLVRKYGLLNCGYGTVLNAASSKEVMIKEAELQSQKLKQELAKKDRMNGVQIIGSLSYIPSISAFVAKHGFSSHCTLDISNLGLRDIATYDEDGFNIENMFFSTGVIFCLSVVATSLGGMNLIFTATADRKGFADDFESKFQHLVETLL